MKSPQRQQEVLFLKVLVTIKGNQQQQMMMKMMMNHW
jgi:hypothetical protein